MPTRSNRFLAGMLTGYGSIATNIVYTMTSIPLALHYLDKDHFGLWALALQISAYLNLIDLGMSGAVSRFVADHKDDVNGGVYGSHLLTGSLVFAIQGLFIALTGITFSCFAPSIFAIPSHLASDFKSVLFLLSSISGTTVALRSLGSPLWAFQRSDVVNGCGSLGLLINLAMLWLGFQNGWGVLSFAIAQVPTAIGTFVVYLWTCRRNHYYPSKGKWGKPSMSIFRQMFHFGKDNLLIALGAQLINATQIMIISRILGLDSAATFSVATKFYAMAMQLVNIPVSSSAAGFAELHVRGESQRFIRRYWELIIMTLATATLVGACLAMGNRSLVSIWTNNAIQWSWTNDLLLAALIVVRNLNGCFIGMFGLLRNWKPVRHILFLEGIAFVPMAILLAGTFGMTGVLTASLISHLAVTTILSARSASRILGTPTKIFAEFGISFALIALASTFAWWSQSAKIPAFYVLAATFAAACATIATAWYGILTTSIRCEIKDKVSAGLLRFKQANGTNT